MTKDEALKQVQEPVAEAYALADKVRIELDKKCCPGVYMNVAWEAVVTNYRDLTRASPPAAQPPLPVQPVQAVQEPTDKQIQAAIDVWFENFKNKSYEERMRAAFKAANIKEQK